MIKMNLRVLLAKKEITAKELSEITGIGKNTLSAYVNNTNKHIVKDHLNILCKFFNCELNDLIEYKKD